jgi:hypothetical protein
MLTHSMPRGMKKLMGRVGRLTDISLDCLGEIMTDSANKAADRISAAKLVLDFRKQLLAAYDSAGDGTVHIVIEGCPPEYAE